jgi:hypothetical protein
VLLTVYSYVGRRVSLAAAGHIGHPPENHVPERRPAAPAPSEREDDWPHQSTTDRPAKMQASCLDQVGVHGIHLSMCEEEANANARGFSVLVYVPNPSHVHEHAAAYMQSRAEIAASRIDVRTCVRVSR